MPRRAPRPRRRASIIGITHATCGLTARPTGTHVSASVSLVVVHPPRGLLGIDEGEAQRADALLGGQQDRVAAASTPPTAAGAASAPAWARRCAAASSTYSPSMAGERRLGHAADRDLEALEPLLALGLLVDAEAAELGLRRRLARAELDPAARDQVERRDALGDAGRMVVAGRGLDDAVAEADVLRALAGGGEEHLGRGGVASTPRGSGARPPTRSRSRARSASSTWSSASCDELVLVAVGPTAAGAGARRRCRTSCCVLLRAGGR